MNLQDLIVGGKLVWENRDSVRDALRAIKLWFKKNKLLIIGPGGTGKTTLARILAGEIDFLTHNSWDYSQSYGIERLRLNNQIYTEIVVAPGQRHRRESWATLKEQIVAGKYRGVILVNAYGHHSLARVKLKLDGDEQTKAAVLKAYFDESRNAELTVLKELAKPIQGCCKKIWLLSLVTKQDLWYAETTKVHQFYTQSDYQDEIAKISADRLPTSFRAELSLVSLVISNLNSQQDGIIKKNAAGFDHRQQVESLQSMLNCLAQLMVWESEK